MKRMTWIRMLLFLIALTMIGCEKVGEGKKAELGFSCSKVVIAALDKYYLINSKYPKLLQ